MRIGRTGEPRDEHSRVLAHQLRDRHTGRVLANHLHAEHRWDRPCRAFNLQISLPAPVTSALGAVQDAIAAAEPALLRVPRHALHSMVAWLVPERLAVPAAEKERRWQQYGPRWREAIAVEVAGLGPFRLRYAEVVATDSAIIALAWPAGPVNRVRRALAGQPGLESGLSSGELVHTTLFRYREPLADPAGLLKLIGGLDVATEFTVGEFVLVRDRVFPSISTDVLDGFRLGAPSTTNETE